MSDWYGLYSESWKGTIVEDAFTHPAKFSRALVRFIYDHLLLDGLLRPGDRVVDPFGGVALGALDAMRLGMDWTGCELEEKFVALGQANIDLWRSRYAPHFAGWGTARLLQGDSRRLASAVAEAQACVTSPPFGDINAVNDPKYATGRAGGGGPLYGDYGSSPGQLGRLAATNAGFAAAASSPPYAEARIDGNGDEGASRLRMPDGSFLRGAEGWALRKAQGARYGKSGANLGNLPAGDFDGAVSSPPYEDSIHGGNGIDPSKLTGNPAGAQSQAFAEGYGDTAGQLGEASGDTFWSASRAIVEQVRLVLKPGGVAVWVVKDYVRNRQIVPFCDQWRRLCEAVGFETLHEHRAWLVEERGAQHDIFGEIQTKRVERKSFFRRLAERNGSPRIDWETVLCMRKPA